MNNTQVKTETQTINLIEGKFTPSEASDIINAMLDKKINFHNIQTLRINEGDHNDPCQHDNERLKELLIEKARLKDITSEIRMQGKRLQIDAIINIKVID